MLKTKLRLGDEVIVEGRQVSICEILSDQLRRYDKVPNSTGGVKRGKFIGFLKPEISVHKIHFGTVLKNTSKFIGFKYAIGE